MTDLDLINQTVDAFRRCSTPYGMRVPDGFVLEANSKINSASHKGWVRSTREIEFNGFAPDFSYRLVSVAPRRIPLDSHDFAPGSAVRMKGSFGWAAVEEPCETCVYVGGCMHMELTYQELMNNEWEITRDFGKTWEPCSKVAE